MTMMKICCFVGLMMLSPRSLSALKMTPDALDEVKKDPWSALASAESAVEKETPSSLVEQSVEEATEAEDQSGEESTAVTTVTSRGAARRGGGPARPAARAGDILAMQKAYEHISNLLTKPACMHFAKVMKAQKVGDLVTHFDVQCQNIMNHRRGFVGENIVAPPVGQMACRHTHAFLNTMEKPKDDLTSGSDGEICGAYQEMVNGAVAHLSQEDKLSETLNEIGKINRKKAAEAKKRDQKRGVLRKM